MTSRTDADGSRGRSAGGRLPLVFGALATSAVIVFIHRDSPRTFISAHGMLHTAVARQFTDGLAIPPDNPFMAGAPLPYYWIFHFLAAMVTRVLGVHPLMAFELLVIVSIAALWLAAGAIGQRLTGSRGQGVWVALLALCGAQAIGAWYLAARLAVGSAGLPADDGVYLWGIVHPIVGMARVQDPYSLYGPLLYFFINVTSRPLALGLLMVMAASLLAWLRDGKRAATMWIVVSTALCTAFSPLIGLAAGLSLVGGLWLAWLVGPWLFARDGVPAPGAPWERAHRPPFVPSAAMVGGIALAAPSFLTLASDSQGLQLGLRPSTILAVATASLLPALLAVAGIWWSSGGVRRALIAVTAASAALVGASIVLQLPASNDVNFFHAGALLLSVPAAAALFPGARPSRFRFLPAAVVVAMVPTTLLVIAGFLNRPPVPVSFEGATMRRVAAGDHLDELYRWLSDSTALNAIIVTDPRRPVLTAVGNSPELPAMTGRALFISESPDYLVQTDPGSAHRMSLAVRLVEGERVPPVDMALLLSLNRPVYLVTRQADSVDRFQRLVAVHGAPAFRRNSVAAFVVVQ